MTLKTLSKGLFITFEGGEGAGKTTLIQALASRLSALHLPHLITREPGGTALGDAIRDLLLHRKEMSMSKRAELLLFLAARAQHVEEKIRPALAQGQLVLCDRFQDSTLAYQGMGRGVEQEKVLELCTFSTAGLVPDLTFYLDIDPQIGLQRAKRLREADRFEGEQLAFHQKVRTAFQELARAEPQRIQLLDATRSKQELFDQAWAILKESV